METLQCNLWYISCSSRYWCTDFTWLWSRIPRIKEWFFFSALVSSCITGRAKNMLLAVVWACYHSMLQWEFFERNDLPRSWAVELFLPFFFSADRKRVRWVYVALETFKMTWSLMTSELMFDLQLNFHNLCAHLSPSVHYFCSGYIIFFCVASTAAFNVLRLSVWVCH